MYVYIMNNPLISPKKRSLLRLAILMMLAPFATFAIQGLFELLGCTGGFSTLGPQVPDCTFVGLNFGGVFSFVGKLNFAMVVLFPATLAWIGSWFFAYTLIKRKTP